MRTSISSFVDRALGLIRKRSERDIEANPGSLTSKEIPKILLTAHTGQRVLSM